jgi:hypothetical protein
MTTAAPSAASLLAIPAPMPFDAPVTTAFALDRLDQRFDRNLIFEADQGERLPRRLGESLVAHAFQPEHGVLPVGPEAGAQLLKRVIEIENNRL